MTKEELRIVFMGTPEFAVGSLAALVESGYNVVAVVTQPDKPVGRHGSVLQPSQVKQYAVEHNIPVLQPEKMKDESFVEALRSYHADLQVVVAFRMLPEVVWAMPRFGTFNVHASLLPQYRGAAPINWAIINGERETGVTTFFLDHDIDTGRVVLQKHLAIGENDNVEKVYDSLMALGAEACLETVDKIIATDGNVESMEQADMISDAPLRPAPKLFKENCRINFKWTAGQVHNFVRGLSPVPGAWCEIEDENGKKQVLKIYETEVTESQAFSGLSVSKDGYLVIRCGKGCVKVLQLQLAGKKRMSSHDFLNGIRNIEKFSLE